jgi:hypothetical protein
MPDLELKLGGHEKFAELYALYPTGGLSEVELAELRQHVEICENCRALLAEYRRLNQAVIPTVADRQVQTSASTAPWDQEEAKRRLFAIIYVSERQLAVSGADFAPSTGRPRLFSRLPDRMPL